MSCSEQKLAANRANAQRSTGPRTDAGKAIASRNATKHGLTAEIVPVAGEDGQLMEAEKAVWIRELAPSGHIAARLAERAFRAYVRLERCEAAHDAHLAARSHRAEELWELQRTQEVQTAITELPTTPSVAVARLKTSAEGCDWLIQAWETLRSAAAEKAWSSKDQSRALDLLGLEQVSHPQLFELTRPSFELDILHEDMRNAQIEPGTPIETIRKRLGDQFAAELLRRHRMIAEAAPRIVAFIDGQIADLQARAERLRPNSDASRELAVPLSLFDPSKEGRLLYRYVRDAEHALHKNLVAARSADKEAKARGFTRIEPEASRPTPAASQGPNSRAASAPARSRNEPKLMEQPIDVQEDQEREPADCPAENPNFLPMNLVPPPPHWAV